MKKNIKKIPKYWSGTVSAGNQLVKGVLGVDSNSTEGVMMDSTATGAEIGGSIVPGWGHLIGAGAGFLTGAFKKGSVDPNTGEIQYGGIFGRSKRSLRNESNRIKTSLVDKIITQDLNEGYYSDPNNSINTNIYATAAEGGIMRQPVDALVSKGELIYNPMTKKLSKVPGSKGKPNKADDVYARLYEGDVVISNSPTMLMSNGKTPAQNLEGLVDKYATGGTVKAREAIIKKVVNWQEANKTKPQEYAKFNEGIKGVNKYGYNKNMSDFAYWDKDKNEYKKEYLDWVNNLTEQDVRDIESGKYGDMSEYFSKNKGKKLDVATAQKLMTDKKYGNWHKIGQAVVDNKIKNNKPLSESPLIRNIVGTKEGMWQTTHPYDAPIKYNVTPMDKPVLEKIYTPSVSQGIIDANRYLRKNSNKPSTLDGLLDMLPIAASLFGDYDYHSEEPQISPVNFIPAGVSTEPIRRAANDSYAMTRYNQANISPNTGTGMAYGLQAASNRAKTLADAYNWQQDTQNKLIAQNVNIYNDWAKRYDAARYQAIADTRANEGAAQQMRDSAIRDAYEFAAGRRNDRMRLAMMEPLAKYAFDDDTYKKIYSKVIV